MIHRLLELPTNLSFFLFGPRQTGKTTLVNSAFQDRVWKVNLLESDAFAEYLKAPWKLRQEAESRITRDGVATIVIDEVQRVPPLLSEVHLLMDKYPGCRFVLTGSSARKLKRGGADLLGGRAVERFLFPLLRREVGDHFDLDDALRFGSLPSLLGRDAIEKQEILSAYVNTYLREEIREEGIARNLAGFSRFLDVAASQCGELVNFSAIGRECMLNTRTVQSYYEILEDTLVGFRLDPWRKSIRKRLAGHPKFYLFDLGLTNAVNKRLSSAPDPALRGRLFEQFIILETRSAAAYQRSESSLFYWRTNHGAEVDLLIVRHGEIRAAIEVKSGSSVDSADLSGLRSFREEHPGVPLYVVCSARNSFDIGDVQALPWSVYLDRLPELL